ncbi:TnsA endonuclease N-terminal domain-containing protein [Amycolatopsis vastitatis]|uniref:TnsA endonuclease N-terminal domain-containing protein n=1 Tax=Amycolatopsis vastitatis TaxID=1905142 RepID=UPI00196AD3CC
MLFADFDPSVHGIVAQPFLLQTERGHRTRRHVPDFLLLTDSTPIVVDVKPRRQLSAENVAVALTWTRQAVESRGWRYEVWTEPPEIELPNVRSRPVTAALGCSTRSSWKSCATPFTTASR